MYGKVFMEGFWDFLFIISLKIQIGILYNNLKFAQHKDLNLKMAKIDLTSKFSVLVLKWESRTKGISKAQLLKWLLVKNLF